MLDVDIRPIVAQELGLIEQHISFDWAASGKHRDRLMCQRAGGVVYLVAWLGNLPVGHGLLKWDGTNDEPMSSELDGCPDIEDLFVVPQHRSRGVGAELLGHAEILVAQDGYRHMGLAVAIDNPRARSLYERKGYVDTGLGEHRTSWTYLDSDGLERQAREVCHYLVKPLK